LTYLIAAVSLRDMSGELTCELSVSTAWA